jgi:hypothetical protein
VAFFIFGALFAAYLQVVLTGFFTFAVAYRAFLRVVVEALRQGELVIFAVTAPQPFAFRVGAWSSFRASA